MEAQFRTRGIYRPNAQRLSISLAPLVVQRSLLFRVKADLATKTHYSQLTPTSDETTLSDNSPGLFTFTASAHIISAALTVASMMSAASAYSQESWKGPQTPFVSAPMLGKVDTRRHAIAFSPSVQWSDLSDVQDPIESAREHELVEVPLRSASAVSPKETLECTEPVPMPSPVDLINPPTVTVPEPETVHDDLKAATKLKKKKRATEDTASLISKHSKAFGKVMSRISLQPSKKEISAVQRRQTAMATIRHPLPEFNLSELKPIDDWKSMADYRLPEVKTPGPIRKSFIVGHSSTPEVPTLPQASQVVPPIFVPPPTIMELPVIERPADAAAKDAHARRLRATMMPGTPSWRQRSLTPPPSASPVPTPVHASVPPKKGHRRFRSSPAVMNFDFHGWDEENVPPLPPMPVIIPAGMKLATPAPTIVGKPRARSQSVVARPSGVRRAVAPPFPPPRARQASI
ncbi:hypothetical protein BDN70DRAFT_874755 [Pholiota conissans]|uniref:Uncharacterized protein n=1 Tax=Pholiota conissans TaxID=109636 RepID=A0A9P5Z7W3_9AGAR|nr:hypothetical protein BDN70DRAFT_874755 [Pholiota conissans]